jgi:hypothetical protein
MTKNVCKFCSKTFKSKAGYKSHFRRIIKCYYEKDTIDIYKDLEKKVNEKNIYIQKINNNFINFPNSYKLMINKIVNYRKNNYHVKSKEDLRDMFLYGYDDDDENILEAKVEIDKFYAGNDDYTSNYYYLNLNIKEIENISEDYYIGGMIEGIKDGKITLFDFYQNFIDPENIFNPNLILNDIETCTAELSKNTNSKIQIPKRYYVVFKPIH